MTGDDAHPIAPGAAPEPSLDVHGRTRRDVREVDRGVPGDGDQVPVDSAAVCFAQRHNDEAPLTVRPDRYGPGPQIADQDDGVHGWSSPASSASSRPVLAASPNAPALLIVDPILDVVALGQALAVAGGVGEGPDRPTPPHLVPVHVVAGDDAIRLHQAR